MAVKVSLVEDPRSGSRVVIELLRKSAALEVTGVYGSSEEAIKKIPLKQPDVVLIDIDLPGMSGIECTACLKKQWPGMQVLVWTLQERGDLVIEALRAGATGYLLKNAPAETLVKAIAQVHAGGSPLSVSVSRRIVDYFQTSEELFPSPLTSREQQILELLDRGHPGGEVAQTLDISINTVRTHLHSIYKKLRVRTRADAIMKLRLLTAPPRRDSSAENTAGFRSPGLRPELSFRG